MRLKWSHWSTLVGLLYFAVIFLLLFFVISMNYTNPWLPLIEVVFFLSIPLVILWFCWVMPVVHPVAYSDKPEKELPISRILINLKRTTYLPTTALFIIWAAITSLMVYQVYNGYSMDFVASLTVQWFLLVPTVITFTIAWLINRVVHRNVLTYGAIALRCWHCGYSLQGLATKDTWHGHACPECGKTQPGKMG